jgi:hypothetical protein
MPTGVPGKEQLVRVDDGAGTMLEVEYQGSATYATGVSQNLKKTKNGFLPFQTKDGATIKFAVTRTRPMSTAQARLYALAQSGEIVNWDYIDPTTGGLNRAGAAQVSLSDETANDDNLIEQEVTIAFVDDPTETVTA